MKTTLLIMAAGIGSRFGTGIKQLEPVDDAGHIIMDYSIHDAIEAGFNHVVFIIRKDIEKEFKEAIGDRIASICASHDVTVDYAFQDINDIPGALPEGRTKPWGTGCVLSIEIPQNRKKNSPLSDRKFPIFRKRHYSAYFRALPSPAPC